MVNSTPIRVLVVDDDEDDFVLTRDAFSDIGHTLYQLDWERTFETGLTRIKKNEHDVYLLDYRLGAETGIDLLRSAGELVKHKPFILLTGQSAHELDMEAMRIGAADFLGKADISPVQLERTVRYTMAHFAQQEELRLAKKTAEEATLLRDKFVSLVAHDLKGPLGSMQGMLMLLQEDFPPGASSEAKLYLDRSLHNLQKMLMMIDNLLNLTRMRVGKITPHLKESLLKDISEYAVSCVQSIAALKQVEIIEEIPIDKKIVADPELFGEVILNLLSNAIKFTPKGGKVKVHLPEQGGNGLSVTDTGVGVSPSNVEKIFRYEEKTSTPGTAGEPGTGFGLPLSMDIMKAHGGDLRVVSKKEGGSTFTATLP